MPTVLSLHVAKATRLPTRPVDTVEVETQRGIVGDRYHGSRHRQVSVQSAAALAEAAELYAARGVAGPSGSLGSLGPEDWRGLTRRNVTVSDGEVPRTPGALIRVGPVLLEVVRVAAPCKLLDDTIGAGAQEVLRRRAGSICRVLEGGTVRVGDPVELAAPELGA